MISVTSVFDWMLINADCRTNLFSFPPLWRRRISVSHKGKRDTERKTKGAHLWALCEGWAIRPFQHRGLAPFVTWPAVGTYGTLNVSSLPSLPLEIIWQCPFDQRSAAASPMEVKCIKLYRYVIVLWISILDCITIVSVVLPRGFPYWVWMMFQIYGYM